MRSIWMFALLSFCGLPRCEFSFLPSEHHEFFFKNNLEAYRTFCSDQQVGQNDTENQSMINLNIKLEKNIEQSEKIRNKYSVKSSIQVNCSKSIDNLRCWGYEKDAKCRKWSNKYPVQPFCTEKFQYYDDLEKNKAIFYDEADFGYVERKRKELKVYCKPVESRSTDQTNHRSSHSVNRSVSSSLQCTDYLRFCEGRNIFIDFRKLATIQEPMRYRTDVLADGDVGGWNCQLDRKLLNAQAAHRSPLQSWYEELEHFKVVDNLPMHKKCDITLDQTTYVMKLDALTNLYHHFCDFINLYVSLHLANDFSPGKQILIWDTYPYRSNFGSAWKAFTDGPLLTLDRFKGKTVCFKHVVFPLLPRTVYGLYYNMPLISGCQRSGLFHAFNRHLLNGVGILKDNGELFEESKRSRKSTCDEANHEQIPIRITFLRRTTAYRRVLNEEELISQISDGCSQCRVTKVDFNHQMPFREQLTITARTDVFIGIHGAGLTHLLFLPDWAAVFELFNCDDDCYKDLARLRGVQYVTWKDRSKLKYIQNEQHHKRPTSYLKFTDYQFDKDEFMSRLQVAISSVRKRKAAYLKKFACPAYLKFSSRRASGESGDSMDESVNDLPKTDL